jgi:hypothetical protein
MSRIFIVSTFLVIQLSDFSFTVNSKAANAGKVTVNYCRCRNVSKPSGAKPGLVYLNGEVSTIAVNIKSETLRLDRLLLTKGSQDEKDPPVYGY